MTDLHLAARRRAVYTATRRGIAVSALYCVAAVLLYTLAPSPFPALGLTAIGAARLFRIGNRLSMVGVFSILPSVFSGGILFVLYLVQFFHMLPLSMTDIRISYLEPAFVEKAALMAAIHFLFATALVRHTTHDEGFYPLRTRNLTPIAIAALLLTIISTLVVNAGGNILEGGYGGAEYKSDRWGGWPLVFIAGSAFLFYHAASRRNFISPYSFGLAACIAYWLYSGNRSEVLNASLCLAFVYLLGRREAYPLNAKTKVFLIASFALVIAFFDFLGTARVVGFSAALSGISPTFIGADNRIDISTIGSSAWTIIAGVGVIENRGKFELGATYLAYLANSVPSFIPVPWDRVEDIAYYTAEAGTIGGSNLSVEPYLNFGFLGVIAFGAAYFLAMNAIAKAAHSSGFWMFGYICLIFYYQRFFFYGFIYLWKLILLLAVIWLISMVMRGNRRVPAAAY